MARAGLLIPYVVRSTIASSTNERFLSLRRMGLTLEHIGLRNGVTREMARSRIYKAQHKRNVDYERARIQYKKDLTYLALHWIDLSEIANG